MAVYTVYEPPLRKKEFAPDPERFAFVRDGFHFWAFLLAPLWMLRRGLWLVLFGYILLTAAVNLGLYLVGASATVTFAVGVLIALLVGFEAASLRRLTLARRGWRNVGIVVGDDMEAAERRFFDGWVKEGGYQPPASLPTASRSIVPAIPVVRRPAPQSEVIGLFPEPGASR
jgi:hypothetical protein